jgi:hypothetical protein
MVNVDQLLSEFVGNPYLYKVASEITELKDQVDSYVNEACIAFQTECNKAIAQTKEEITHTEGFGKLTEAEQQVIITKTDELNLEYSSPTLDNLQNMVNKYTTYYIQGGDVDKIRGQVKELVAKHAPAVVTTPPAAPLTPPADPNGAHEPAKQPRQMKLKRSLTTRDEVQQVITELQNHLDDVSEEHPIEFSINE